MSARKQVNQSGVAYSCLLQLDVNLTTPPLPSTCTDTDDRERVLEPLSRVALLDRRDHPPDRDHVPAPARSPATAS